MEDDAFTPEISRSVRLTWIETLHKQAVQQKNPIYIWEAILMLLLQKEPLPQWAIDHLTATAYSIWNIAKQVSAEASDPEYKAGKEMTPPAALRELIRSMGMVRGKVNAFTAYREDALHAADYGIYEGHRHNPSDSHGTKTAVEQIVKRRKMKISDPEDQRRSVTRRVSKGKKIRHPG
jgi:hypothetical protein